MKKTLTKSKIYLLKKRDFLNYTYHVDTLGIFGSVALGTSTEASDIDILVAFSQPIGIFTFIELEDYLSELLGKKVDLVTNKALKPTIKNEIMQQMSYV